MATDKKDKNSFKAVLDNLKSNIMKVQSKNVSKDINTTLAKISGSIIDKNSSNYSEMMKNTMSDIIKQKYDFKNLSKDFFQSTVNAERFTRYANAEEIVDCIPYCARALKVISDEVVAPDEIDKSILQIIQEDPDSERSKKERSNIESIINALKFEDYIHDLVYETLKLGDQFVEVCDYTSDDVPLTQIMLNEAGDVIDERTYISSEVDIEYTEDYLKENQDVRDHKFKLKPVVIEAAKPKKKKKNADGQNVDINNIRLIFHDPRYIVKLQSQRFKLCLGYIVLPRYQYSGSIGGDPKASYMKSLLYGMDDHKDLSGIDKLYSEIMNTVKRHVGDKEFSVNKNEVMNMMARCIKEFDKEKEGEFRVRYVPPDMIEHFVFNNRRFFPYGEGIFYKTTFASKLLMALQSATTIKRISDSTDARIFYVETGVPRNARDVIEEVREARTKKKVSIDKLGSIGSIPNMISSYEDYYIPQVNGKRFMEFDSLPPTQNARDATEELKYFRDILVSTLDVPPAFLNLEENLCLALDTVIPLTDGRKLTLQQIISEYQDGIENEVYSYDNETGMVFTNLVEWAGVTRTDTELIRIYLDNDEYIDCTYDHPIMLRDGSYVQASELKDGDSLMPLYTRNTYKSWKTKRGHYREVYHTGLNLWEEEHKTKNKYVDVRGKVVLNHKVIKVEYLSGKFDTGDITVSNGVHNFAVGAGVFVHNSNKSALSHENILFARTIVAYQSKIAKHIEALFNKLHMFIYGEQTNTSTTITFYPPKMLQIETQSEHMRMIADLINTLKELGINEDFLKEKYLPINWSEHKEKETKSKLDAHLEPKDEDEFGGAGGGGVGGY